MNSLDDKNGNCIVCGKPWLPKPNGCRYWFATWAYWRWLFQHTHSQAAFIVAKIMRRCFECHLPLGDSYVAISSRPGYGSTYTETIFVHEQCARVSVA